jgi:hypothetical protein
MLTTEADIKALFALLLFGVVWGLHSQAAFAM